MSEPLDNYLVKHRKATPLTHEEIAFLLALHDKGSVMDHESLKAQPRLETALAYAALYRTSLKDLFLGLYKKVELRVHNSAEALRGRLKETDRLTNRKLTYLDELILATASDLLQPQHGTEE